jgi:hypothetical protein
VIENLQAVRTQRNFFPQKAITPSSIGKEISQLKKTKAKVDVLAMQTSSQKNEVDLKSNSSLKFSKRKAP